MYVKHQPWTSGLTHADMVADIEWNMWSNRVWPFNWVSENEEIAYVSGGGPAAGRLTWTATMDHLIQTRYDSHEHAWQLMRSGLPADQLSREKLTKKSFLGIPYTAGAPDSGWLLAWIGTPVRWVNRPRPPELRFRPNGWAELPEGAI